MMTSTYSLRRRGLLGFNLRRVNPEASRLEETITGGYDRVRLNFEQRRLDAKRERLRQYQ
jgi:hypothetical protein